MADFLDANGLNTYHQGVKDRLVPAYSSSSDQGKFLRISSNNTLEWVSLSVYTGTVSTPQQGGS